MIPISASTRLGAGAALLFMADSAIHTNPSKNTKVRWTRISTPNNRPIGMDQFLIRAVVSRQSSAVSQKTWIAVAAD
jgi:hypothetical protein